MIIYTLDHYFIVPGTNTKKETTIYNFSPGPIPPVYGLRLAITNGNFVYFAGMTSYLYDETYAQQISFIGVVD